MAQTEKDYLSLDRQTRIDLALSFDIHRSNAGAYFFKSFYGLGEYGDSDEQLQNQIANTQFELNKDTNPFFRKYVNERLKSEKWIANHIASLTFVMLWDILSERQPTVKDLYMKVDDLPDGFIIEPRETRRILNEYYDYMHYHPVKWSPQLEKLADDPKYFVWSFRGPRLKRPLPSEDKRLKAVGTPLSEKEAFNAEIHVEDFADPCYLERLFSYRRMVLKIIETIKRRTRIRKEFCWLIDELVHSDYALTVLFQNASREVEKRWFEVNLGQDSKVGILYQYCKGFTESEIARTITAYKMLLDDLNKKEYRPFRLSAKKVAANALEQITLAALNYANRGSTDIPEWLFSNLLANGFELEGNERFTIEHNLGLFEMLNSEYAAAAAHFQSAAKFWASEHIPLLEEIDTWNLALALERIGRSACPEKQKHLLFDILGKNQGPPELRLFLIRQFADISDLLGDTSASARWLERGLKYSATLEDFFDIALYFEARLGSLNILGTSDEQRNISLSKAQAMRESCCRIFGDTGNFMVVIEKKFYLLREEWMH